MFIANNPVISPSRCMVLRMLTALVTMFVNILHFFFPEWKEEVDNEVRMGEALYHCFL